jgi:peptide chain release factor subunit 1
MISAEDVRALIEHRAEAGSGLLSIYLNVDQSRAVNLNRGFEAALRNLLRKLEEKTEEIVQRKDLLSAVEHALHAVQQYGPHARSLVMFCEPGGVLWQRELTVSIESSVRWGGRPYIRPLLEAFEEFKRYAVVLTDKGQARLFTVFLDQIEEHVDALATEEVKHIKSPGSDHGRSQMQVQRKADGHVRHHLKNVAELLVQVADEHSFEHLILAGPVAATNELQGLLPTPLRRTLVGTLAVPMDANPQDILAAARQLQHRVERSEEQDIVGELITAAAKNNGAVTGLEPMLRTLHEGRVWQIVYADGYAPEGGECSKCGYLFANSLDSCLYCNGKVQKVGDVLARAVSRVIHSGGKAEQVREEAARSLQRAGGVGAFLRF